MKIIRCFAGRMPALQLLLLCLLAYACAPAMKTDSSDREMANRVRNEFIHAWNGYKEYAWRHDDLKPLSKSYHDWYSSPLYMTPVDALDTMRIMGLTEEAKRTQEFIAQNLSFDHDMYVKNFEITIRILGALLTNYQMTGDRRLLALAVDLGNRLLPAFHSPTGMPYMYVNLKTGAVRGEKSNPAEIGTLLIEFGTLSKLSHLPKYYDAAKRALVELYKRRSPIGLVGSEINVETGEWTDPTSHISGGIDSYYEYLFKCWRLFGDHDCYDMWQNSIAAVKHHLSDRDGYWYGYADMNTGKRVATHYGALDAFFPAVLALSGDVEGARRLQSSSDQMWTKFGIEPEEIDYTTMQITYNGYPLRPEIIESTYYLYRITGSRDWQTAGTKYFDDIVQYCRTPVGYAALEDVVSKKQKDEMQSFFLAETLKYSYLLYAPPGTVDFEKVTFNTEAHPITRTW